MLPALPQLHGYAYDDLMPGAKHDKRGGGTRTYLSWALLLAAEVGQLTALGHEAKPPIPAGDLRQSATITASALPPLDSNPLPAALCNPLAIVSSTAQWRPAHLFCQFFLMPPSLSKKPQCVCCPRPLCFMLVVTLMVCFMVVMRLCWRHTPIAARKCQCAGTA